MQKIKVNLYQPNKDAISQAAQVLKNGGLIVYPTDTAYGLGANALDEKAVRKVFEIKGRDYIKPIHVVVKNLEMAKNFASMNHTIEKIFATLLPGPITLILTKKPNVSDLLTAGLPTLGIRIPNCQVTKMLSAEVGFPYTTTSTNLSGGKTSYSVDEVLSQLDPTKIDFILDAGELPEISPSTLLDLTCKPPKILRQGPISKEEIEKVLGEKVEVASKS